MDAQVYMHLLNTVCNHLVSEKNVTASTLDEKLSSLFDDDVTSTVPAQAFEQLFGAHRHDVDSTYTVVAGSAASTNENTWPWASVIFVLFRLQGCGYTSDPRHI